MQHSKNIVGLLKAAGEITRLRMLALLSAGELNVKDFTEILAQSQPRVSRHLKLLADANLVTRHSEGAWAYFRLADEGEGGSLAQWIVGNLDPDTADLRRDRERLAAVRAAHRAQANAYFAKNAGNWDRLRSLHAPDSAVEQGVLDTLGTLRARQFIDLGTGTGRMLELLAGHYEQATGIDSSREMLAIARAKIEAAGLSRAQVRHGDIIELDDYRGSADLVMLHQVLHYFDDPAVALAGAAQCLTLQGAVVVVDFAPHEMEFLRTEQAHRRLGLSEAQMDVWARAVGLAVTGFRQFAPDTQGGLTVCLWRLERSSHNE